VVTIFQEHPASHVRRQTLPGLLVPLLQFLLHVYQAIISVDLLV